jgi:hypothetical protein
VKKVLLAIVCLAVLGAVSYYKSVREDAKTRQAYQQGKEEGLQPAGQLQTQVDSLNQYIVRQQDSFVDSTTRIEYTFAQETDSLKNVIDSLRKARPVSGQKTSGPQSRSRKDTSGAGPVQQYSKAEAVKHKEILSYYKQRYEALPKDLSDYEKRIARDEIREETAQKFSISLDYLDKIRKEHRISY